MAPNQIRSFIAGCSTALALVLGLTISLRSWDGMIYFYTNGNERTPAAIPRAIDFSHLEGTALMMASQERLLTDARAIVDGDRVGIELGHFVSKGENGRKEYACSLYDALEIHFTSADSAVSGHPSLMIVRGPCTFTKNVNRIDPVWIPVAQIVKQKVSALEYPVAGHPGVRVNFENMGDEWPRSWNLESVRLYSANNPQHQVLVDRQEIENLMRNPMVLSWNAP